MEELKAKFEALSTEEKIKFMKIIMPDMCTLFGENPTQMLV